MTIRELEQQLADMGLELYLYIGDHHYYCVDDSDNHRYAYVSKTCRFAVDTGTDWFKALETKKRKRLFNLLTEFADKIIGMLPPIAAIKKTKVAVE